MSGTIDAVGSNATRGDDRAGPTSGATGAVGAADTSAPREAQAAALRLEGFSFAYPGTEVAALRDVSLEIAPGEVVGVVGAEGSGRTSLGMVLSGFVPRFTGGETAGVVEVAERDPRRVPAEELAGTTAMVFEDPESQLTQIHVLDEVQAPLINRGVEPGEAARRATDLLERVGLDPALAQRRLWHLPAGDKMRLAVAAALATDPQVLVLDAVAGSLDPAGRARLAELVRELAPDLTVVVIEDDLELVASLAERLLVLVDGTLAADGPPADVLADTELVDRAGIAVPLSLRLALELGLDDRPVTVDHFCHSVATAPTAGPERSTNRASQADRPGSFDVAAGQPRPGAPRAAARRGRSTDADTGCQERFPQARLVDVVHSYSDGTQALRGVSLALHAGEVHGLVGGNGAGKSTLLRMLVGLAQPDEGRVEVAGGDVAGCRVKDLIGTVGIVLPDPDRQITEPTVVDEVGFSLRRWHRRGGGDDVAARVRATCRFVGLDEAVLDQDPRLLPRAQRRFVTLAAALILDPPIVVLDEPSASLDATWRDRLLDVLRTLREQGKAILLAENDIDLVAAVADQVTLLDRGRVTSQGWIDEVLGEPNWRALEQARARPPRAAELGQAIGVPAFSYEELVHHA